MDSSNLQTLIVVLLVSGCSAYAVWSLMPSSMRRNTAVMLLRLPLPKVLATRLRKHAEAASGCGCSGCDRAEKKPATSAATPSHPITFHRQPRG